MLEPGQKLGSFEVLRRLRTGGMANLYLARRLGVSGFQRPVAIKVVLPHLARDEVFNRMFVDEALLSARIDHPNVVRVEELGRVEGTHFLVMEYVHGCSLARLWEDLRGLGRRMQPRLAVWVAIQVLDGLHAAHETRGPDGKLLGVVHRDVSPQNILLAYRGHVKLIDFGIAKARGRLAETDHGVVRGKLKYMSPEQTRAVPLDARADVYALGIVLWELLTGERYFGDTGELEILERIRDPRPRAPGELVDGLPEALDAAVLAALSPDRDHRPRTAMELRRRLAEALPVAMTVDAEQLASLLHEVMGDEITRQAELVPEPAREAVGADPTLVESREIVGALDSLTVTIPPPARALAPVPALPAEELEEESDITDLGARTSAGSSTGHATVPAGSRAEAPGVRPGADAGGSSRRWTLAIAAVIALVLGGTAIVVAIFHEPTSTTDPGPGTPRPPEAATEARAPRPEPPERVGTPSTMLEDRVEASTDVAAPAERARPVRRGGVRSAEETPTQAAGSREPDPPEPPPGYRLVDGVPIVDDIR